MLAQHCLRIGLSLVGMVFLQGAVQADMTERLTLAAEGPHRSAANIARNPYRHPVETLQFFGLADGMRVIEISPGGMWYSEVLAPVLQGNGELLLAGYDTEVANQPSYRYQQQDAMIKRLQKEADVFGAVEVVKFSPPQSVQLGPDLSADMVLTFRNFHGWVRDGLAADNLKSFYQVLKPGGVLGVVQHRAAPGTPWDPDNFSGYVTEKQVIELAQAAGFVLEAQAEINANPKDTRNHPKGVWTLPPVLRLGDIDRERYIAIGESDRMTLRFRKPVDGAVLPPKR
jgi:predicted methyltransferase